MQIIYIYIIYTYIHICYVYCSIAKLHIVHGLLWYISGSGTDLYHKQLNFFYVWMDQKKSRIIKVLPKISIYTVT
jgi:hypothetical protein